MIVICSLTDIYSENATATAEEAFSRMKDGQNPDQPLDLDTAYGKYLKILGTVAKYDKPFDLQQLFTRPEAGRTKAQTLLQTA
jgi:hypothetical protein